MKRNLFVKIFVAMAIAHLSSFMPQNCQAMDQEKVQENSKNAQIMNPVENNQEAFSWEIKNGKTRIMAGAGQVILGGLGFIALCPELLGAVYYNDTSCAFTPEGDQVCICIMKTKDLEFKNFCYNKTLLSQEIPHNPFISYPLIGFMGYGALNLISGISTIVVVSINHADSIAISKISGWVGSVREFFSNSLKNKHFISHGYLGFSKDEKLS